MFTNKQHHKNADHPPSFQLFVIGIKNVARLHWKNAIMSIKAQFKEALARFICFFL